MKKIVSLFTSMVLCLTVFFSCDKDETGNTYQPPIEAVSAFKAQYPQAKNTTWSKRGIYNVAKFNNEGSSKSNAWYNPSNKWSMTEDVLIFTALPAEVKTAHRNGIYGKLEIKACFKIEHIDAITQYIIEVTKIDGSTSSSYEYELYYMQDGTFLKEILDDNPGDDFNEHVPFILETNVKKVITQRYPEAQVVTQTKSDLRIWVEIYDKAEVKTVTFSKEDGSPKWVDTYWIVPTNKIPAAILSAIDSNPDFSREMIYRSDATDSAERPIVVYKVVFEKDGVYPHLLFKEDGTIIE